MKGFMIAGPASGVGKTTVTAALMAALKQRGLRVQAFKCGPDFIDPGHHRRISGRASHNLDKWMLPVEVNRRIFAGACQHADVAVVEGMMGLFDGVRGKGEEGSSAQISKLLGLPVLLAVDASSSARSIAALVHGFQSFDPQIRIAGVILNRVANARHAQMLIEALKERNQDLPVGWLPHREEIKLKERYLGLQTAEEISWTKDQIELMASLVEQSVPLDELLARCSIELPTDCGQPSIAVKGKDPVRIGIARDRAFCFYYEAGLDELRRQGAELVEFSPLASPELPGNLDALYFGGGYPELYSEILSRNTSLLSGLREFAAAGKLVYGECGGLIFMSCELITRDGSRWPMAGLLPLTIEMTDRLVHFGYANVHFEEDSVAAKGTWLRGHSFHCSRIVREEKVDKKTVVQYSLSGQTQPEGFAVGNVFGSYIHLHFAADPAFAERFVSLARRARQEQEVHG